jgi:hypothetical protein
MLTCYIFFTFLQSQELPGAERFEMRDLGVPYVNAIPPDEGAITSLYVGPAGNIYGGTTGPVCHLFVFSPRLNRVKPLGQIDGHQSIHHSLTFGGDGMLYIGTGLDEIKQYPISDPVPGHGGIVISLWNDIKQRYNNYEGGHLFKYDPSNNEKTRVEIGQPCKLEDKRLYGLTYPDGHFFIYDLNTEKFSDKGEIYQEKVYGGPNRSLRSISRALICDRTGNVYGSSDNKKLFMYDVKGSEIIKLDLEIPYIYIAVIEALVNDSSGTIWGGTSEGFLFKFNPYDREIINLGKPLDQMRIRALTIGPDANIYGIAGERKDKCHFFSYDPETGGYTDFGIINVDRSPYYVWSGKQFDAIVTGLDGTIYIGESERKSHLFLFYP